jgi:ADP-dependent phosphofructokinase/glucokinase
VTGVSENWTEQYAECAAALRGSAARAPLTLTGFSACVDAVYTVDAHVLDTLTHVAGRDDTGLETAVARTILERIAEARGGELFREWDEGPAWAENLLGSPTRLQVGGTGPQAAWALATLGAPSVVALRDRSPDQLSVLHPAIGICGPGGVTAASESPAGTAATKPRHYILEFTAGTRWSAGVVGRSTRIILRFAHDGLERDEAFARLTPRLAPQSGAGLVSGMNGIRPGDERDEQWLIDLARQWRESGLPLIHLELAEYPVDRQLADACKQYAGVASSIGMSLSELRALTGSSAHPAELALGVAQLASADRVCIHADTWSVSVHRRDPAVEVMMLLTGNLMAACRAAHGVPTADLDVHPLAIYVDDFPNSRDLGGGWRVDCVPSPYLYQPRSTVGLGDTFVAGTLLAHGLVMSPVSTSGLSRYPN